MTYDPPQQPLFSIILSIGVLSLLLIFSQCYTSNKDLDYPKKSRKTGQIAVEDKQRGAHVFGQLDSSNIQALIQNNIKWITMVSYSAQKDIDSPKLVYYRGDSLAMARRDSVWRSQIALAHAFGLKVFLKPHIWLTEPKEGKWRSDIFPSNEDDWQQWQKDYREFILLYAKMAQQGKVELFCIGTELSRLTVEKAAFWKALIREVRTIYSGKITYAANWYNEYEGITFWEDLDYIGIQAYFPLVKNNYPSIEQISKGWNKYLPTIAAMHKKYNRKILFTEMGYKSTPDSAIEPWKWIEYSASQDTTASTATQANCYQAFFDTVWDKEWFAGVHIWQLRSNFVGGRGKSHLDFTPQGKPAVEVIAKGFE